MLRLIATVALIGLPMVASAQSLTSAVDLCNDPMTTGLEKLDLLPLSGWTPVENPDAGQIALIAGSIGPGFNADMAATDMQALLPQIGAALADAVTGDVLQMYVQGAAILLVGVNLQPGTDLEHLTCLVAAPPTDEIAGYWQDFGGQQVTPLMGREVLLFQGSVSNIADDITYSENMVWSRVPTALTPLTDSFRYERLETAQQ